MAPTKTFGQIIREKRQELGISQKELATKIKKENGEAISPQYQNDIEFDRRDPPSEFMIEQYATALKLDKDYLILVAGKVPADVRKLASENPEKAQHVFQVFRRKSKGG